MHDLELAGKTPSNTALPLISYNIFLPCLGQKYDKIVPGRKPKKYERKSETQFPTPLSRRLKVYHVRAVFPETVPPGSVGRRRSGQVRADSAICAAQLYRLP